MNSAFEQLDKTMHQALETYSNVHRGSGHYSRVTTELYETARKIVLDHLDLSHGRYTVIFCSPRRAAGFKGQLDPGTYKTISSRDIGLALGVEAIAVTKSALSHKIHAHVGGGTARLVSRDWVIWSRLPDRLEAGTPAIINVIAFARALQLMKQEGIAGFEEKVEEGLTIQDVLYSDELVGFTGKALMEELRKTLIGKDVLIPTAEGLRPFINLDNGASTPTFSPIFRAASLSLRQPHEFRAKITAEARNIIARFLGAPEDKYDIIFTSNTTEGINLVAESLQHGPADGNEPVLVNTLMEHNSNDLPWRQVPDGTLLRISVDDCGLINLDELEKILREYNHEGRYGKKQVRLVAVSGASNVLGVFNDPAAISNIVHKYGARLLVDAAQMVAHRKVNMAGSGIDYLAFSAHKAYAPFGTGVLVTAKEKLRLETWDLDFIRSSGEENIAGITALAKSLVLLERIGMDVIQKEEQEITARLIRGMKQIPKLRIYGINDPVSADFPKKGGVIVFDIKGVLSMKIAGELAGRGGIGVRFGCHCSHILIKKILKVSPGLEKFQYYLVNTFPAITLPGLTRVSLGLENTEKDIDNFVATLGQIAARSTWPAARTRKEIRSFVGEAVKKVYAPL